MKKFTFFFFICLLCHIAATAQENLSNKEPEKGEKGFHQLSFMLSHTNIMQGVESNSTKWVSAPSFGFDYNYWISNKLAVGLHTDLVIENYKVESEGIVSERTKPFSAIPALSFKPKEHSIFVIGMGEEFAKEENLAITRLGYEYAIGLPKHFELSFAFTYDIRWKAYDTWSYGISLSKKFR